VAILPRPLVASGDPDNKLSGLPTIGYRRAMGRQKILHIPGHRHFVTFGTYRRRRFLDSDRTRDIVVEVLQKCLHVHGANCAGFVVMPDHVHALLFGDENFNISSFIQVWKKTSSYRIKQFYRREFPHYLNSLPEKSPIWESGFYDFNVDTDEKQNEKLDYMHHNPVAAKLTETHVLWKWSSARFYELDEPVGVTINP
jgi:putative transposase